LSCVFCGSLFGELTPGFPFDNCAICLGKQFYVQKDFNRALGCAIVLVGIALVPASYGLSLPLVALIDWLLYRRVSTMTICYRCGAEYRDLDSPKRFKPYVHAIAMKYDKYR